MRNGGSGSYLLNIADYPKGYTLGADETYKAGIDGVASNAQAAVRQTGNYTLGNVMGRDAIVAMPADLHTTVHIRIFVVGLRIYDLIYAGPTGAENGSAALAFLNSFKLN
jgi:hypothetical protein